MGNLEAGLSEDGQQKLEDPDTQCKIFVYESPVVLTSSSAVEVEKG